MEEVSQWSTADVANWLQNNGFTEYVPLFCNEHKIDGKALLSLNEHDLKDPPLEISILGDIKRLGLAIKSLQIQSFKHTNDASVISMNLSGDSSNSFPMLGKSANASTSSSSKKDSLSYNTSYHRVDSVSSEYSNVTDEEDGTFLANNRDEEMFPAEYIKLLLSFMYMFTVFLITAMVMVIVHDRVPDMDKWPPLPDIILDNLPYIPWAFKLCELIALVMSLILCTILLLHKHRFIIMRRMCVITGTMFLLRCITMLITSLSVPGKHLDCQPFPNATWGNKIERAFIIWRGGGMSLQGVRTCGDYMFSGHTVMVTLLNHFITEYTPSSLPLIHIGVWIGNIFAIFFILAAHEHYSIDVFIAFYISSRLFLYYHSLANNRVLRQPDRRRTRVWFPLFSFFEYRTIGIVPNQFEWPLAKFKKLTKCLKFTFDIRDNKRKNSKNGRSPKKYKIK